MLRHQTSSCLSNRRDNGIFTLQGDPKPMCPSVGLNKAWGCTGEMVLGFTWCHWTFGVPHEVDPEPFQGLQ